MAKHGSNTRQDTTLQGHDKAATGWNSAMRAPKRPFLACRAQQELCQIAAWFWGVIDAVAQKSNKHHLVLACKPSLHYKLRRKRVRVHLQPGYRTTKNDTSRWPTNESKASANLRYKVRSYPRTRGSGINVMVKSCIMHVPQPLA